MARPSTRAKVHAAVLDLARSAPAASLTMEGIAARAGVGKQTLYRSWPSTGAIVFDALRARSEDADGAVAVPDSGDVAVDLLALAAGTVAELTDPLQEPLLRTLTAQLQGDLVLAAQHRELLVLPQLAAVADRFASAGAPDPAAAAELFVGPILHRWLLRTHPFDDAWVRGHVARVLRACGLADGE